MKTFEEIATEIANRLDSITEFKCPRDVKNPGLYFGAMLALVELQKIHDELEQQRQREQYLEDKFNNGIRD